MVVLDVSSISARCRSKRGKRERERRRYQRILKLWLVLVLLAQKKEEEKKKKQVQCRGCFQTQVKSIFPRTEIWYYLNIHLFSSVRKILDFRLVCNCSRGTGFQLWIFHRLEIQDFVTKRNESTNWSSQTCPLLNKIMISPFNVPALLYFSSQHQCQNKNYRQALKPVLFACSPVLFILDPTQSFFTLQHADIFISKINFLKYLEYKCESQN